MEYQRSAGAPRPAHAPDAASGDAVADLALWKAIVASSLDPLFAIDACGTVLAASESVERVFGWSPAEFVGQNIRLLMPEPHRSAHDSYLEAYRRTGATHILGLTREFQVLRKDGTQISCDLSVSRADLPNGAVLFTGSFRDVTEQRLAEARLAESERRFHAVFDGTFQCLGLLEPDGTILEINRTALEAGGMKREEILGTPFWEAPWCSGVPTDRERVRAAVERARAGEFVRFELEFITRSGESREVDFSLMPVRDENGLVCLLIPEGRDVTELKRAQRLETDLLRRLAAVGEQAAVLAHEIKNPITAVNAALRAVANQLGEDHRVVLEELSSRMQRLEQLMRGTLSFAKPMELECEAVNLRGYLDRVVGRLRLQLARSGARVDVVVEPADLGARIDPRRLEEVLANLVLNSAEAKPDARIVVSARALGERGLRIAVDDDGPGVPVERRPELFKPFATTQHEGTGLGLAISRKIVEAHGGTLEVQTSDLGGARFEIDFVGGRA